MEKTELFIPFTKKLAEAAGLEKEVRGDRYFRCLRMKGFFPPEGDLEDYAEELCNLLLDKHEEALLYTEKGLRQKLKGVPEAEEICHKLAGAWEKDAPDMYVAISRRDEEYAVVMGYDDYVEAILVKNDKIRRASSFTEIER